MKGGSKGWDEDDTLLILAIKGREYAPIFFRLACITIGVSRPETKRRNFSGVCIGNCRGGYRVPIPRDVFLGEVLRIGDLMLDRLIK